MDKKEQDQLKREAATKAAALVKNNSVLGVGTGSTVAFFIDALGQRKDQEGLTLKHIVTTSNRSKKQLESLGFKVDELKDIDQADLTVDGADRVADTLDGIKGGGGALTLEKNVAINSKRNVWIVDESKVVEHLSGFPLPVEVLPISAEQNFRKFAAEDLKPQWRENEDGSRYITHYGNYIIDLAIDPIPVPEGLAAYLDKTVGVVEHGLFLGICNEVIIAKSNGTIEIKERN
ncbi:ribose-5-phosphate isomerase RpiA [Lactobacillus rodentium]|uniref:Ribose-5-phosphate isomerase A n=1 Tax=Lactobacillus rodentium TaxID=947835 RepID=A0A2Z6T6J9_9LACO|nr:ribose-5-phosphate isomerase RpiA [Lactobacillus rodentium]MCR1894525.1 ribose-5-phosphate isomerase RpiA [Lactobacillus rodentium]GBG04764.1 ribose-5-phosphate isomerase A [Lactobacillus rodentium]